MKLIAQELEIWNKKAIIADCLTRLGYKNARIQLSTELPKAGIMKAYLYIIQKEANAQKNSDVLEMLAQSGLIS